MSENDMDGMDDMDNVADGYEPAISRADDGSL
jgi:hypothetical protein